MANGNDSLPAQDALPPIPPPSAGDQPSAEPYSATHVTGVGDALAVAGRSFMRGASQASPADIYRPDRKNAVQDPMFGLPSEQEQRDVKKGGFWLSSLPEFAGEMSDPRGAVGFVGRAAAPMARAITQPAEGLIGRIRQAVGGGAPSLGEARAADRAAAQAGRGTYGMQERLLSPLAQRAERVVGSMPGGAPIARAATRAQTARMRTVDFIVNGLTQTREPVFELRQYARDFAYGMTPEERTRVFQRLGVAPEDVLDEPQAMDRLFNELVQSGNRPFTVNEQIVEPLTRRMGMNNRRLVAGNMLERMATTSVGEGGALAFGRPPTVDNFLRNWAGMHPELRQRIFGPQAIGTNYEGQINFIVDSIRGLQPYAGMASRQEATIGNFRFPRPGMFGTWSEGVVLVKGLVDLAVQHDPKLLAGLAKVYGGTNVTAYALTNPDTAKWVAAQVAKYAADRKARGRDLNLDQLSDMR